MGGIPIGRIAGFPVSVNWSVLVILWLFTWSLASLLLGVVRGYSTAAYWLAGACGALILLGSLLAHELTHAILAPGHRPFVQPGIPQRAGRAGAAADRGHRPRARADRGGDLLGGVPGDRQRRGRGGVRGRDGRRRVRGGGERAEFPLIGGEDFSFVLEQVPGAFVMLGACPPGTDALTAPTNRSAHAGFVDAVLADGAALYAELALRRLARG